MSHALHIVDLLHVSLGAAHDEREAVMTPGYGDKQGVDQLVNASRRYSNTDKMMSHMASVKQKMSGRRAEDEEEEDSSSEEVYEYNDDQDNDQSISMLSESSKEDPQEVIIQPSQTQQPMEVEAHISNTMLEQYRQMEAQQKYIEDQQRNAIEQQKYEAARQAEAQRQYAAQLMEQEELARAYHALQTSAQAERPVVPQGRRRKQSRTGHALAREMAPSSQPEMAIEDSLIMPPSDLDQAIPTAPPDNFDRRSSKIIIQQTKNDTPLIAQEEIEVSKEMLRRDPSQSQLKVLEQEMTRQEEPEILKAKRLPPKKTNEEQTASDTKKPKKKKRVKRKKRKNSIADRMALFGN